MPGYSEAIGHAASSLFGITLEFDHEDLSTPQLTLLGSGELVGFHMRTGAFASEQTASVISGRVSRSMPESFTLPQTSVAIDGLQLRTVMTTERKRRALIGVVKSPDTVLERSRAVGTVLASAQSCDKRLTTTKQNGGSFKIAFCDDVELGRGELQDLLNEVSSKAFISTEPGVITSASIELSV
jgi:hypothetical protein